MQGKWMYLWPSIDVDTLEVLYTWVTQGRSGLMTTSFLRRMRTPCEDAPVLYVDRTGWHGQELENLGAEWEHWTFGLRTPVEQRFGILTSRVKRFYDRWPHNTDLGRVNK